MTETNPLSPEVRAELVAMNNRLVEIEDGLWRIMQQPIAHRLRLARESIFAAIHEMKSEEERWERPF